MSPGCCLVGFPLREQGLGFIPASPVAPFRRAGPRPWEELQLVLTRPVPLAGLVARAGDPLFRTLVTVHRERR